MGKTTFSGPIRTGRESNANGDSTIGTVPVTQWAVVSGEGTTVTAANFPNTVDILDVRIRVDQGFNATANSSTDFLLGDGTTDNKYGSVPVSARGMYDATRALTTSSAMTTGISNWKSVTGKFVVETSAAVTAPASGIATVYITYVQVSGTPL